MIVRNVLKIQEGSKIRTNSVHVEGDDEAAVIAFINAYCDELRGVLKGFQEIISCRGYETTYEAVTGKWVDGLPLFEETMSYTGKTGISPGNDLPVGMKLLINTKDATPFRDGRILVTVPYTEGEVEANGQRFALTSGNSIKDNTDDAMLALDLLNNTSTNAFAVNLHRNVPTPSTITSHYVRYVEKYRKRL